ncbi:hypothetical protein AMS68_001398 [Peltaster fructicola]|uniref:t-SNARE coiled-coil homology domain-containing protein n=1 Tax=Peltaster fructicola TaxID=286661 RepID=A0A6H0XML2_9PEZI|nr:hypothetical protein AMS68_001398 [Peltaster fructicola]
MPFGRSKKDGDDLDSKKASLFGGRSSGSSKKTSSPAPGSGNPYANAPASGNPYANAPASGNPYANAPQAGNPYSNANAAHDPYAPGPPTGAFGNMSLGNGSAPPPSYSGSNGHQHRDEKSPVPPGGYGGGPRYQDTGYSASNGYGSDPYGNSSRSGPSGYGGMGRDNKQDITSPDEGRSALFGDAPQRAAQQPQEPQQDTSYGNSGGYDSTELAGGYGSGPARELTAEEQEEEDVQAAKSEIKFIKQQDVASTRNARRLAEQSEQIGRETLARLGQQGERIHNTERNLDMASNQNRLAEEKARELKTLNRSMFAVHVANPFTARKREEAAVAIALDKTQRERAQADATRAAAHSSTARQAQQQRDLRGNVIRPSARNLAERAKYQFEADSEDEAMENEIDDNLEAISRGVSTLGALGRAMGEEIESQNKHLGRISKKTDKVDDQIAVNRARLDRIR